MPTLCLLLSAARNRSEVEGRRLADGGRSCEIGPRSGRCAQKLAGGMKISVIMASFNSSATIGGAIESFLNQDFPDRELLVIDGQSSDTTCAIVQSFANPLIRLWSEKDNGIYDAMNKGLSRFSGDAFGFLNSDDRFHDARALSMIAERLQFAPIVTGNLQFVSAHDGSAPVRKWKAERYSTNAFRRGWSPPHPTTYARREVFDAVGRFDPSYRSAGDYDWLIRALEVNGFGHDVVDATLVDMMIGGESTRGFGAVLRNAMEMRRARRSRLGVGPVDLAMFRMAARKIRQVLDARMS